MQQPKNLQSLNNQPSTEKREIGKSKKVNLLNPTDIKVIKEETIEQNKKIETDLTITIFNKNEITTTETPESQQLNNSPKPNTSSIQEKPFKDKDATQQYKDLPFELSYKEKIDGFYENAMSTFRPKYKINIRTATKIILKIKSIISDAKKILSEKRDPTTKKLLSGPHIFKVLATLIKDDIKRKEIQLLLQKNPRA